MNLPQEAAATYRKAVAAQPGYYRTYNEFGLFYWEHGQNREAEDLFRRVTALAPEFANGHNNLGLVLMNQGRYAEAEEALLRALRLQESARILTNLGLLYTWQEKFAEAVPFFEKSIAVGPTTALRYSNLGDGYSFLGRTHEAAQAYRNARRVAEDDLARNPRQALSRAILGWVYAHLGEPDRAAFETAQALGMEPGAVLVMRVAALTYEELHQRDKALEALRNAPLLLLEELNRYPPAKELRQDHRFLELMAKKSVQ
jgi:Tfp pilus assembly protein PilF